ncbi:M56 family metallopeptidase [Dyadobacter sp. CY312]|uniref:M56 family metallopeptidase n=1 Tax=Dyadobacter sp. CY312 TaxID=2907303 RepID=UPI001F2BAFA8|nr:M56 family metallopeptidase [Dyadobacter sp. CY312]MCE7042076.1 M48 family metalloprotease [Dyadobacter sp. CY312]
MKLIYHFIPDSMISAVGWTLVHSVWQGILLAIFAFAGFFILNKKSANARYNLGIILLGLQVAASIGTYFYYYLTTPLRSYQSLSTSSLSLATQNLQTVPYAPSAILQVQLWLNTHLFELVLCWFIGTGLLTLRFAGAWIYAEYLRSSANIVMDQEWRTRFGMLTARMNISKSIEFRQTAKVLTPMVIGVFRPAVLIPFGLLTGFSTSQIEAILAHELAHIRRNDYLVNLLQSFVEVIFFFHPALWWISERVRTEREHCCDDIALSVCGDKMVLANALVKVAEWQSAPELAMAFASKKPLLLNRIRRVVGITSKPTRSFGNLPVMLFALCLIAGISFYAVAKQEKKQEKKDNKSQPVREKEDLKKRQEAVLRKAEEPVKEIPQNWDSLSSIKTEGNNDKIEALAKAYHSFNKSSFSIDEIRSSLTSLTEHDIDMLSHQLPASNQGNEKSSEEDREKLRHLGVLQHAKQMRIEILYLDLEKKQFDIERYHREIQKIEWAKEKASQMRANLSEKHSKLLHPDSKKGSAQLSDEEIEKQLADFEEKIKEQQNKIVEYNNNLMLTKVNAHKAELPYEETEKEIEKLSGEIEEINQEMNVIYKRLEREDSAQRTENNATPPSGKRSLPPPPKAASTKTRTGAIKNTAAPKAPASAVPSTPPTGKNK